jgi:hypothetical protein
MQKIRSDPAITYTTNLLVILTPLISGPPYDGIKKPATAG